MTRAELIASPPEKIFEQYNIILSVLREKGLIRSQKVVGDYAESLVADKLNLTLDESLSNAGFDAVDSSGYRYQIKGRHLTKKNKSDQISALKSFEFDYLVAVLFKEDFSVDSALRIHVSNLEDKINPERIFFNRLLKLEGAEEITQAFTGKAVEITQENQTMADFLEDYIGAFDSSEKSPDGSDLSENTGRKFKELMLAKHRGEKS